MAAKKPIVKILRSSKDEFLGAYPVDCPPAFLENNGAYLIDSVASAQDCTGIAVTIPRDEAEEHSLKEIREHPTARES